MRIKRSQVVTQVTLNAVIILVNLCFIRRLFIDDLVLLLCGRGLICSLWEWTWDHSLLQVCKFLLHLRLENGCIGLEHFRLQLRAIVDEPRAANGHFWISHSSLYFRKRCASCKVS